MEKIAEKSLKEKREEQNRLPEIEQNMTEMELDGMERDQQLTELELAVLELQKQKGE